jgi:predicted nucleic acid-binding protein
MRTALDTNILSQIWSGQPSADVITEKLSNARAEGALVVSAPVFVELAAMPIAKVQSSQRVENLLREMNVAIDFVLGEEVWRLAATAFAAYAIRRRHSGGGSPKRLLADFVIAAHAMLMADRFMTRDVNLYAQDFPNLRLI